MSNARNPIVIGALVALVAVAAFWFAVLAPKRTEAAALEVQVDTAQAKLAGTRAQAQSLEAAKGTFAADYTSVLRLGKAVPTDDDVRSLMVQIDKAAKRSDVDFRTIQLNGGAGTTTPPATTAGATAAQSTTAKLPPGASVGTAGFPTMPFSFEFEGEFFTLSSFFARLDRLVRVSGDKIDVSGRLLTVDAFTFEPGEGGFPSMKASVGATAYLLPGATGASLAAPAAQPVAAAGTPAAPAPAPPVPPTATSTGAVR